MFTTRTGVLKARHDYTHPQELYAVEYTHLPEERSSRWDWNSSAEDRDRAIEVARARAEQGDSFATYNRPNAENWEFIPDVDPTIESEIAREFPGTREEQATAKLRELIRERNTLRQQQVNRETAHAEALARVQSRLQAALAEITDVNDDRLDPIWRMAAEAATEEGFCSEYDRLCDRLGIPGRPRMRRAVVNVSFNVYAYAHTADEDAAVEQMEECVRELVRNLPVSRYGGSDGDVSDLDITEVDVDSVEVYE